MFHSTIAVEGDLIGRSVRVLNYAPGPLDTDMQARIRDEMPEGDLKKIYVDMHAKSNLVQPQASAKVLMQLLKIDKFKNGAHVDYYDAMPFIL
jgi:sepiapterin reductase